jgi:hypothetical protein
VTVPAGAADPASASSGTDLQEAVRLLLLPSPVPEVDDPNQPNMAFVTSTKHAGDLGGLEGANAICQARAEAAGLPKNTYIAWLSTSTIDMADRLGDARGWIRVDEKPFVDTAEELVALRMVRPLIVNELGEVSTFPFAWTGTTTGSLFEGGSCDDWTSGDNADLVDLGLDLPRLGYPEGMASMFTTFGSSRSCGQEYPLYCFGVDKAIPVEIAPEPGRAVFLSETGWTPGDGIASADQLCMDEAQQAGLTGSFKALLADDGASAQSRFDTSGLPWVRVDGVAVAPTAEALFSSEYIESAMSLSADGQSDYGNFGVWTGAADPATAGTAETTCNGWTDATDPSPSIGGRSGSTKQSTFFSFDRNNACSATWLRLYCLQE